MFFLLALLLVFVMLPFATEVPNRAGPKFPGRLRVSSFADTDGDGRRGPGESGVSGDHGLYPQPDRTARRPTMEGLYEVPVVSRGPTSLVFGREPDGYRAGRAVLAPNPG